MFTLLSIEGNIGAGKSTFVRMLRRTLEEGGREVIFLEEPVQEWEKVVDEAGVNIISKFYSQPRLYSFAFQMTAFITRLSMLRRAIRDHPDAVIVSERCLDADRRVFATLLRDQGKLEPMLYAVYNSWFEEFEAEWRGGRQVRLYLRAPPDVCLGRVAKRMREGEQAIDLDYLERCHAYHEAWLCGEESGGRVVTLDASVDMPQTEEAYAPWMKVVRRMIDEDGDV